MKNILFIVCLVSVAWLSGCAKQPISETQMLYQQSQLAYQQQDYHTAYLKLLVAAQRNYAAAQYAVGYMLYNGIGTKRDQTNALLWMKKAAENGNPRAIAALQKLNDSAEKQVF